METVPKIPSKMIEVEISIKLLEYLKRKSILDDGMYHFVVNRLIKKQELEKKKFNDYDIND